MISILIPSYNHSTYVIEAIDSARQIDLPGRKIYIIDDCSDDDSVIIIKDHLDKCADKDIILIEKKCNKGAIDSVTIFLSLCNTEYVYLMASDDIVISSGIKEIVRRMEISKDIKFIIGGGEVFFPNGKVKPIYTIKHKYFFSLDLIKFKKSLFLNYPSPILSQSSVFRLSSIRAVDGFDKSIVADDFSLFIKLFLKFNRKGIDFDFDPNVNCVRYRQHDFNSYRNLLRQAIATSQVLVTFAPEKLRNRAVGKKLAYYSLVALKAKDFDAIFGIVKMVKPFEFHWYILGALENIFYFAFSRFFVNIKN